MSLFRDEEPILKASTKFEIPNGASAPTIVKAQIVELTGLFGVAAAGATGNYTIFIAPPNPSVASGLLPLGESYQVLGATAYWNANSSSGTVDIVKVANGTADSGGTTMLTGTISTAAGANTNVSASLVTNPNTTTMLPTDRLVVKFGGTATGLTDFTLCVFVART